HFLHRPRAVPPDPEPRPAGLPDLLLRLEDAGAGGTGARLPLPPDPRLAAGRGLGRGALGDGPAGRRATAPARRAGRLARVPGADRPGLRRFPDGDLLRRRPLQLSGLPPLRGAGGGSLAPPRRTPPRAGDRPRPGPRRPPVGALLAADALLEGLGNPVDAADRHRSRI